MKVIFFFLLTFLEGITAFAAKDEPSSRTAYFKTWKNKRLLGHVVKQFESESLMSCSQSCLRSGWCTSTNFIMSSKNDDKGTCELNKHDISLINEGSELHQQEGVTFLMPLKVSCYVEIMSTLFMRLFNFVTTGVKMFKNYVLKNYAYSMYVTIIPDISRIFPYNLSSQIHVGELNFSNSCFFLFREFVLKFYQPSCSSFIVIFSKKFQ